MVTTQDILVFAIQQATTYIDAKDKSPSNIGRIDANLRFIKHFGQEINKSDYMAFKEKYPQYFE